MAGKTIPVALVQFDAVPERPDENRRRIQRLILEAVEQGARWIMFHEASVCDYCRELETFAEQVPDGESCQLVAALAREHNCFVSFGLCETNKGRFHITQVFIGPQGLVHRYRKTWLFRQHDDAGYRNEWARFDPGDGPELFMIDGVRATCYICADGMSARCRRRAADLKPQVVFWPVNCGGPQPTHGAGGERVVPRDIRTASQHAAEIGATVLCTNRVGESWGPPSKGGGVIAAPNGEVLAQLNDQGEEQILIHELTFDA